MFDHVLAEFASGSLKGPFTTDGQAILLEDYLEIRPERRAEVEGLVRSGSLSVGPMFVLPDEWLVSGEALVRNLELGRRIVREFGGRPSNAGFLGDLFGHVGQMPQILRGFGMETAFVWRGVEPRKSAHFFWEGSDGSRVLCYRFGRSGYGDYAKNVRLRNAQFVDFEATAARENLQHFLFKEAARTKAGPVLLFDGSDHMPHDGRYYEVLLGQKAAQDFPYEISHGSLDDYSDELLKDRKKISEVVRGELRQAGGREEFEDQQCLIPGVLSSRVWLKQRNVECQTELTAWTEPFSSMASAFAAVEYPVGFLDAAWRWLLQNHAHDSIGGCSIDEVHQDMMYRFAQCFRIASAQTDESLRCIAASAGTEIGERELRLLIANPVPSMVEEPVAFPIDVPAEWGVFHEFMGYEEIPAFRIFADSGVEMPYQVIALERNLQTVRINPLKKPLRRRVNRVTVVARLCLPPLGYKTLVVREGAKGGSDHIVVKKLTLPTRHPALPGLCTSDREMENEFLKVVVEGNGTLSIEDKRTGRWYSRVLLFENSADIGDGWYHGQAVNEERYFSSAGRADVAILANTSLFCRIRIRVTLMVPKEFDFSLGRRSPDFEHLIIDNILEMRAGVPRIEVRTEVDNRCGDHRLRVLFPTGIPADTYFSDGAFDVVERPIKLPDDNHLNRELAVETGPQQSWTAVLGPKAGLAVISSGLMESSVCDQAERPLALTLFRATRRTVLTNGQPDGQMQGRSTFRYWIVPIAGKADLRGLCELGTRISAGFAAVQMRMDEIPLYSAGSKALPAEASLLRLEGGAVLACLRHVQDGIEIRIFNPETKKITASLSFEGWPAGVRRPRRAVRVDLGGRPLGPASHAGRRLKINLNRKEIATVRLAFLP